MIDKSKKKLDTVDVDGIHNDGGTLILQKL